MNAFTKRTESTTQRAAPVNPPLPEAAAGTTTRVENQTGVSPTLLIVGGGLVVYAAALASLGYAVAGGMSPDRARLWLVVTSVAAGGLYVGGLGYLWYRQMAAGRPALLWIVLAGFLMRAVVLAAPPFLEDDYFRYLWDGAVAARGINPYAYAPAAVDAGVVPDGESGIVLLRLADEGRDTLRTINHPELRTIYGPTAQAAFAFAHGLSPWSHLAWRGLLLVFDIATLFLVVHALRVVRAPAWWAAWYWWNPILLREVTSSGHMDALLFPCVLAALLLAARERYVLSASMLALATGAKVWPVVLLPLVLRPLLTRGRALTAGLLAFALISAGLWWPVVLAPWDEHSGFFAYARGWQANDAIFSSFVWVSRHVLTWLGDEPWHAQVWARRIVAGLTFLWVLRVIWRVPTSTTSLLRAALAIVAGVFLLSPAQFPWYSLWMLPLLAIAPRWALLLYAALLPLYYLHFQYPWLVWVQHVPVCVLLIGESIWRRRSARVGLPRKEVPHVA
jgi:hypothetical protein